MTTTFYLIRHGTNDYLLTTLIGRKPGVRLNDAGKREAGLLSEQLAGEGIQHVFTSPLERCFETAAPLAKRLGVPLQTSDALMEVNFGDWTGKTFAELESDQRWKQWNAFRGGTRAPNGETMLEVQSRVVGFVERLSREQRGQRIALVSHGDPLRTVILYYLGMPFEFTRRLELGPSSVSVIALGDWEVQVRCLNVRFSNPPL